MILVIYVAAIMLAFYMLKKIQLRREYEHEKRQERFERLLDSIKKPNSVDEHERSVAREDEQSR